MALSNMDGTVSGLLVHYWKFESSDPQAVDSVYDEINSTDCILYQNTTADSGHFTAKSGIADQNTVVSTVSGKTGINAIGFMHTLGDVEQWHLDDDYWKVPSGASGSYSVGGWFYLPTSFSGSTKYIISLCNISLAATGVTRANNRTTFHFRTLASQPGRIQGIIFGGGAGTTQGTSQSASGILNFNAWNHIVMTVDAVNNSGYVYHDGVQVASTGTATWGDHNYPGSPSTASIDPVGILVDELYEEGGRVAEFGIWSGVLSSGQVSGLYNSGSGVSVTAKTQTPGSGAYDNAIHNWKFSENTITSGTTISDSIDAANLEHVFVSSNSGYYETTETNSIHTRALSGVRDASNSSNGQGFEYQFYTAANSGTNQGLTGTPYQDGDFAISIWYRPSVNKETDQSFSLFSIGQSGAVDTTDVSLSLEIQNEAAATRPTLSLGSIEDSGPNCVSTEDCRAMSGFVALEDTWINYIASMDRSRGSLRSWVNGSGYSAFYDEDEIHLQGYGWNKESSLAVSPSSFRTKDQVFRMGNVTDALSRANNFMLSGSGAIADVTIFSGSLRREHAEFIWNNGSGNFYAPGASGTTSGLLGSYMFGVGIASGSQSNNIGSYLLAIESVNQTGPFAVTRPAIEAWSWDLTKNDPTGYKHVQDPDSPYWPEAKGNLIGGFDAQGESGVSLDFGRFPIDPTGTQTSSVVAMTVQMGDASGVYFDSASGVERGIGVTDAKLWLADETDITTSGVDINLWYQTSGTWLKNHTMTSGSAGVSEFPTTEASGISLGNISSSVASASSSDYIYMVTTLPSGTYSKGQLGGLGNNWNLKISYVFSA